MYLQKEQKTRLARQLLDDFLYRTGITGETVNAGQRYLWTDAFAVQCCFALAESANDKSYLKAGLDLIDRVHYILGRHRPDDQRTGWISGLSGEEGLQHPTAGGLRIGKRLPENTAEMSLDPNREMECDGQYFHYLTRWFNALISAFDVTGEKKYALWAAELMLASGKFIHREGETIRLYWKMKTDLTKPSVRSMGLHDPLEGLICILGISDFAAKNKIPLEELKQDLENICHDMSWFTTDELGIGGLLLNAVKAGTMAQKGIEIPECIHPRKLLADSLAGLYESQDNLSAPLMPAESRLPFRECGLSLGIHALLGIRNDLMLPDADIRLLENFSGLANDLENFWLVSRNQEVRTWQNHRDINAVTLASSLLAHEHPRAFCPEPIS